MTRANLIRLDEATDPRTIVATRCTLVVGNFDGVHRGHQAVLAQAVRMARHATPPTTVAALTFDPHPSAVVGAGLQPLLTSLADRVDLMGSLGVERLYVRHFDSTFASWPPDRFADFLSTLRASEVVVGNDFRFGARRAGDLGLLQSMGGARGFRVAVAEVAGDERGPYSSTRAREAVRAGDLAEVARVLGRPHAITGTVVHGDARGRTLGFSTANLDGVEQLLPLDGVYAVTVDRRDATGAFEPLASGVTNVGVRPTLGTQRRTVEAHLLDFAGDLYGAFLRVQFVARLRGEMKFGSLDELRESIARDVLHARQVLAISGPYERPVP